MDVQPQADAAVPHPEGEAEEEADLHPAFSCRPRPRSHEITCQECARVVFLKSGVVCWHRMQGGRLIGAVYGGSLHIISVHSVLQYECCNSILTLAPHLRAMLLVASVLPPSATMTAITRLSPLPRAQLQGPHQSLTGMDKHACTGKACRGQG